jgi:glycerol-3-phosphate responsive antiterminator
MKKEEAIEVIVDAIEALPYIIPSYLNDFSKKEIFSAILTDRKQITDLIKETK